MLSKIIFTLAAVIWMGQANAGNIIRTPAPISFKAINESQTPTDSPSFSLSSQALPDAKKSQAYAFDLNTLVIWSGLAPDASAPALSWAAGNALPDGLSLSIKGELNGIPTTVGTTSFAVVASHADVNGQQIYTLKVNDVAPVQECSYVYGSSSTMSAWIRHDDFGKSSIYWKGVQVANGVTATTSYYSGGVSYTRSGSYRNTAKLNNKGDYYYYYQVCRVG